MATTVSKQTSSDERVIQRSRFRQLLIQPEVGAFMGALVIFLFFAFIPEQARDIFPTITGAARFLDPSSTLGIMAVAVALLMIGGEFDLSAGAITGSAGLLMGMVAVYAGTSIWVGMIVSLAFCLLVGFLNGWLVVSTGLPSFIVTLASFFILRALNVGVTRAVTDQIRVQGIDDVPGYDAAVAIFNTEIQFLGETFRTSIFWWIALTILATWLLTRTRYGNWIFIVGGDPKAARSVGIPVVFTKISLFMITAGAGWLVGIMTALRLRSAVASQGIGQEFVYIIAAVIGGCLLTGGYGSAIGAAIGALIFGMTRTGIVFAGWETDWFFGFLGIMLLVAVLVNNYTRARADDMQSKRKAELAAKPENAAENSS